MNNSTNSVTRFNKKLIFLVVFVLQVLVLVGCSGGASDNINEIIKLDDSRYKIETEADGSLLVRIPDGRARVPQLQCEGAKITQAFFSDGHKDTIAKVILDDKSYVIRFTRDPELGFELQYDDRYNFRPKNFEATSYTSSDPSVITVDDLGNMTVVGVSDEKVVITATDGREREKLIVTRTVRAPLGVYMLTGQSNAAYYLEQPAIATLTKPGTAYHYAERISGVTIQPMNNADGSMAIGNIEAGLAKSLYDNLGEKVLVVNGATGGMPMSSFVPNQGESFVNMHRVWNRIKRNIYDEDFEKHYEVRLRSYIWVQGEADSETNIGMYKNDYMKLHQMLISDTYGFEYGFIIKVKPEFKNSTQAHEELVLENEDIAMATRSTATFTIENGKMHTDDVHYSQIGDNQLGDETGKSIADAYTQGIDTVTGNY